MKILLIGEYSRLHNSLKEGLISLGHEVTLVSNGDTFKKYSSDFSINSHWCNNYKFINIISRIFKKLRILDFQKVEKAFRFYLLMNKLEKHDIVQLINSDAVETYPFLSRFLYKKLFKKIKNRSLLICGDETPIIDSLLKQKLKYSILTPYFENKNLKKYFYYPLKYTFQNYRKTFNWLSQNCQVLITSDLDYELPMKEMGFRTHFIPNPINTDIIVSQDIAINGEIIIFLGINRGNYIKKGLTFFEEALEIIKKKYSKKVEIITTENIPYNEYISIYNKAHILLDQVYAYDQGYNALEAMAKGKVVFTGAEEEFLKYYNLKEDEVVINSLPDVNYLVDKLSYLIENPSEISKKSHNARRFIEEKHNYIFIANNYLSVWKTNFFL